MEARAVQVEQVRLHQGVAILKLTGCDSRNDAETLRGHWLQVPIEQAIPLEEDEYYLFQLVGLEVRTAEGEVLGELAEVLQTGANDVYVVRGPAGELLLPDIPQVIQEIDLEAGRMLVQLAPGLRDG
jgi:16S rRNA processing protein RimM